MTGKVKCTCGWSWNKSDSSKKDMYICHECGRDNSNNMKNGGWLDNYGEQENYNDFKVSAPEGFVGEGYSNVGRNYSPAWGGQFQKGGKLEKQTEGDRALKTAGKVAEAAYISSWLDKLPGAETAYDVYNFGDSLIEGDFIGMGSNLVGALLPGVSGKVIESVAQEYLPKTPQVEKDKFKFNLKSSPSDRQRYLKQYGPGYLNHPGFIKHELYKKQNGGSLPGATGMMYARIGAPSNGKYAKKTKASAENGAWLDDYDVAQEGINTSKFKDFGKSNSPKSKLQRSTAKEEASEDYRRWTDSSEYKNQVKANKLAEDKAIVKGRKDRINKSMVAQKKSFTKDNWRQQLADETQAIGDKFRIFPEDPDSFVDEWLNPGVLLGGMASDLGSAPLRAQQEDSYMPYVTSIGVPLLTGGLEGIGAKTTGKFINNLVNPLNIVPGYNSVEQAIPGMLKKGINSTKKGLAKGALTTLETLRDIHHAGKAIAKDIDTHVIYPIQYKKEIKQIKDLHNNLRNTIGVDESGKRLQNTLGIDPNAIDYPSITTAPMGSHYDSFLNNVNMDLRQINRLKKEKELMLSAEAVHSHEMGHWMGRESYRQGPEYKKALSDYEEELAKYNSQENKKLNNLDLSDNNPDNIRNWFSNAIKVKPMRPLAYTAPTKIDEYAKQLYGYDPSANMIDVSHITNNSINNQSMQAIDNARYFTNRGVEPIAHLREMRQNMLEKGAINDIYDPISNATIAKFIKENPTDRISSFTKDDYDKISGLGSIFRRLPSVVGAGAVGAAAVSSVEQKKDGGVIKDDMGQWAHPGEITEINSNDITMEGVPYDVLGISDTGDTKLMKPGKNYKFKGKKVTEYPMAKNGLRQEQKGLQNLDQLTNFTNYNTKQPGGWMDQLM
jgi:hypothetical protein